MTAVQHPRHVARIAVYDTAVRRRGRRAAGRRTPAGLATSPPARSRAAPGRTRRPPHRLDGARCGETWTVRFDGEPSYRGLSIDTALYDALITLNHHASTGDQSGRAVLHGGVVSIDGVVVARSATAGRGSPR